MGNKHSHDNDPVGKFEKDFEVLDSLGRGTFGSVYHCQEKVTKREFAIKSIRLKTEIPAHDDDRIINTEHENLVKIYRLWLEFPNAGHVYQYQSPILAEEAAHGVLFVQQEFCNHKCLRNWLDNSQEEKTLLQVTNIMVAVAQGLAYLHSMNIAHRNLTPENVLLHKAQDGKLVAKIGDFGVINEILDYLQETHHDVYFWTSEKRSSDKCQDVYSYSVVVAELLIYWGYTGSARDVTSQFFKMLTSGNCTPGAIQEMLSPVCPYAPIMNLLMRQLTKSQAPMTGMELLKEILTILPPEFQIEHADYGKVWPHMIQELQIPMKFGNLKKILLFNITVTDKLPQLQFQEPMSLPYLEEFQCHLKLALPLGQSIERLSPVEVAAFCPDIRQILFFQDPYRVNLTVTVNDFIMISLSPGQLKVSWQPGETCLEILAQLSKDVHKMTHLSLYKCGTIEWYSIPREFLQPIQHFSMVDCGVLIEDRFKNLFTELVSFVYWGCGSIAFPSELIGLSEKSLQRLEIEVDSTDDSDWTMEFLELKHIHLLIKGIHPDTMRKNLFPNVKFILIIDQTELDTSPLLKTLTHHINTATFEFLDWLVWLNFTFEESRFTVEERAEMFVALGVKLQNGMNNIIVKKGLDMNYYGALIANPAESGEINAQLMNKIDKFKYP